MRVEKFSSDNEYLRELIKVCEKKIGEEIENRLKGDIENKKWFEQKISMFSEDIVNYHIIFVLI